MLVYAAAVSLVCAVDVVASASSAVSTATRPLTALFAAGTLHCDDNSNNM
jgi:hypothetical protein